MSSNPFKGFGAINYEPILSPLYYNPAVISLGKQYVDEVLGVYPD